MSEKTEKENGEKPSADRDAKGLFQPGCAPGPGRGKKKNNSVELTGELLSDMEVVILAAMGDSDTGLRLKAAALAVKLQSLKKSEDDSTPVEPFVKDILFFLDDVAQAYFKKTGNNVSPMEMIKLLPKICSGCQRIGPADD